MGSGETGAAFNLLPLTTPESNLRRVAVAWLSENETVSSVNRKTRQE